MDNLKTSNYIPSSGRNTSSSNNAQFVGGVALHYANLVLYPILGTLMLLGALLTLILARRASIRGYSSMIYLLVVYICDIIWTLGNFLPNYVSFVNPDIMFSNPTCTMLKGAFFYGRVGAGLILTALAMERCLVLTIPKRVVGLSTSKAAMLISLAVMVLSATLTVYQMYDVIWNDKRNKCVFRPHSLQLTPPQVHYKRAMEAIVFTLLAIVTLCLIILTRRKRKSKQLDPIHSSIATAQKYSNQLNRINLIACLMVLHYTIAFVLVVVGDKIYWLLAYKAGNQAAEFIAQVFDLVNFALISMRVVIILCASPKMRKETLIIFGCVDNPRDIRKTMVVKAHKKSDTNRGELDSTDPHEVNEDETAASNRSANKL